MTSTPLSLLAVTVALLVQPLAQVEGAAQSTPTPSAVSLPLTHQHLLHSAVTGHAYRIEVALPLTYEVEEARTYPVLYVIDAHHAFPLLTVLHRALRVEAQVPEIIIVAIGYGPPGTPFAEFASRRTLDLSPVRDTLMERRIPPFVGALGSGGADAFLGALRTEILPLVEEMYRARPDDRALFGHSMGALFGVHALLSGSGLFQRYILGSPARPWAAAAHPDTLPSGALPRGPVFLGIGEEEGIDARRELEELAARLTALGIDARAYTFPGETHMSVLGPLASRGLRVIHPPPVSPR
jgi:uncharacterized protein